ncbi:MAG: amino acid permease [Janthinobacterium lividum]
MLFLNTVIGNSGNIALAEKDNPPFGLVRTTSFVVGNVVGTSVLLLPAVLGKYGSISLLGWLFTSVGALFLAHIFAQLSRRMPQTGGPYAYCRQAFGDFVGFQMAWSYWIANWVSNAAVAIAFVNFASQLWPALGQSPLYSLVASLSTLWLLTGINCISLKCIGNLQVITTVLKLLPLGIITIFGSFYIDFNNFFPLTLGNVSPFTAIGAAATATLFSFMGLETATVPAGAVKDPQKTIPRATLLGTSISAILYIWSCVVIFGVLSPEKAALSSSPFSDVGALLFGSTAEKIIIACAALSCFGTLNGWILLQGQVPYAAAQDHLFPKIFARLSNRGLPVFGLVFSSILISILLIFNYEAGLVDQFNFIVTLTTFAILQPYLYSSAAELFFMFRDAQTISQPYLWRNVIITTLALLYTIWTVVGAGAEIVYLGTFLLLGGIPVYIWLKVQQLKTESFKTREML